MSIIGLAEYFRIKYAGSYEEYLEQAPDMSFGKPINAATARQLKDKLVLLYDKLNEEITQIPIFKTLNEALKDDENWEGFKKFIFSSSEVIDGMDLKDAFIYCVQSIDILNKTRRKIQRMGSTGLMDFRAAKTMDAGILSIQDYIWKYSKRMMSVHDLRDALMGQDRELKKLVLEDKVNTIKPTWDYGPGKNPAIEPMKIKDNKSNFTEEKASRKLK